jgi:hypothetical protein
LEFQVAYILTLPTEEMAFTDNILLKRYPIHVGKSLLITGATGVITTYPSQSEIGNADFYFGGGRRHVLSDAEYGAVVASGYSDLVSVE